MNKMVLLPCGNSLRPRRMVMLGNALEPGMEEEIAFVCHGHKTSVVLSLMTLKEYK